jgi:hypothetical protein
MLRTISAFYLLAITLAFVIASWLAIQQNHPSDIFILAMMAWPMSALTLLAARKSRELGLL